MPGCFRHSGRSRSASRSPCRQWQVRSDSSGDGFTTPRALHVFNSSAYTPSDAMPLAVDASAAPCLAPPKQQASDWIRNVLERGQHVLCQVCGDLAAADHGLPGESQTLPDVASVGHRFRESIVHVLGNEWIRASLPLPAALPHSISGDAATGPPALWSGLAARETAWPGTLMPWRRRGVKGRQRSRGRAPSGGGRAVPSSVPGRPGTRARVPQLRNIVGPACRGPGGRDACQDGVPFRGQQHLRRSVSQASCASPRPHRPDIRCRRTVWWTVSGVCAVDLGLSALEPRFRVRWRGRWQPGSKSLMKQALGVVGGGQIGTRTAGCREFRGFSSAAYAIKAFARRRRLHREKIGGGTRGPR